MNDIPSQEKGDFEPGLEGHTLKVVGQFGAAGLKTVQSGRRASGVEERADSALTQQVGVKIRAACHLVQPADFLLQGHLWTLDKPPGCKPKFIS